MASKTVVELFDDLDGGRADETVRFALDGVEYEIDLSAKHAASLRDTLAVYIGHAHRPASRPRRAAAVEDSRKNGKNGSGKMSGSASLTAEIRRLASESAQKVSEAARAAEAANARSAVPALGGPVEPAQRPPVEAAGQPVPPGPVPALVIPFMEAGL